MDEVALLSSLICCPIGVVAWVAFMSIFVVAILKHSNGGNEGGF